MIAKVVKRREVVPMRKCPKCGKSVKSGVKVCPHCGHLLDVYKS